MITLLTDFGTKDPYVASMKGVISSICPHAAVVDITHEVPKFDVRTGSLILAQASPWFPDGTVHVGVVDPGVGTARRPILVESKRFLFVGPDNGLLMLAAMRDGLRTVYAIENRRLMLKRISRTFHGRDIFAPVAAYLASGVEPQEVGPEITDYVVPDFARPEVSDEGISGEIMYVDGFGNLITNIPEELLAELGVKEGSEISIEMRGRGLKLKLHSAYGEARPGELLAIIDSWGMLEIAANLASAAEKLGVGPGDKIRVSLHL